MSRIGKLPVPVPGNVDVQIDGAVVTVKGPKGTLSHTVAAPITVEKGEGVLDVKRPDDERQSKALHGLTRTLVNNMVIGVTEGYEKKLEIVGVGYRVLPKGPTELEFQLGYSHSINFKAHLTAITGQKPLVNKAKKSIAQFKLREGMPIGAHVTLRGDRMWEFLDRLLSLALPRIRDFRGLNGNQFDGRGNYTFGLTEQVMFHEIDQDRIDRTRGMDITLVTTATNDDQGRALLKALGFPFKEN